MSQGKEPGRVLQLQGVELQKAGQAGVHEGQQRRTKGLLKPRAWDYGGCFNNRGPADESNACKTIHYVGPYAMRWGSLWLRIFTVLATQLELCETTSKSRGTRSRQVGETAVDGLLAGQEVFSCVLHPIRLLFHV